MGSSGSSSSSSNSGGGGGRAGGDGRSDRLLRFTASNGAVPGGSPASKVSCSPFTDTFYTVALGPASFPGGRRSVPLATLAQVVGA